MPHKFYLVLLWNLSWCFSLTNSCITPSYSCQHQIRTNRIFKNWVGKLESCVEIKWTDSNQITVEDMSSEWCSAAQQYECRFEREISSVNGQYHLSQELKFEMSRTFIDCSFDIDDEASIDKLHVYNCGSNIKDEKKLIIKMARKYDYLLCNNTSSNLRTSQKMIVTATLLHLYVALKTFHGILRSIDYTFLKRAIAKELNDHIKSVGLTPEGIMQCVLNCDEDLYLNAHFKQLVRDLPSIYTVEQFLDVPKPFLQPPERITLLLLKIGCLKEKIELMEVKAEIKRRVDEMKRELVAALNAIEETKNGTRFHQIVRLSQEIALSYFQLFIIDFLKDFSTKVMIDGKRFIDLLAIYVKKYYPNWANFVNDLKHSDSAKIVSADNIAITIQKMEDQLEILKDGADNITNIKSHEYDQFNNVMRIFIAETRDRLLLLRRMHETMVANYEELAQQYNFLTRLLPISFFFEGITEFKTAFNVAYQRSKYEM
ncbi:hypothetical protein CHUAL_003576 [Chamberlinius hualienensis]